MKIVQIGARGTSGSSAASRRLNNALQNRNIQSVQIEMNVFQKHRLWNYIRSLALIIKNRIIYGRAKSKNNYPFFTSEVTIDVEGKKEIFDADIIHVHWTEGFYSFQNYKWLFSLNKPIVWTCHDSWVFTGGCCVKEGCEKYRHKCHQCKYLSGNRRKDISYWHFIKKQKMFCIKGICFVAPSVWMKNNLKNSFLKEEEIYQIANIPDYKNFYRKSEAEISKRFAAIKPDHTKMNLMFGADSLDLSYKGAEDILDVLQLLYEQDKEIVNKIRIYILGGNYIGNDVLDKFEHYYLGHIDNEYDMSCAYSMADILMFPSHDDNLPYMVIESLACGTPVLAYAIGGIPEIIEHKQSGYLVENISVEEYYMGLKWMMENLLNRDDVAANVRRKFNEKEIIDEHIELYLSFLKDN